jgi:hypothetical protein
VETIMNKNRRCTDILFLLIFFAFMVGLFAAGIYGMSATLGTGFWV